MLGVILLLSLGLWIVAGWEWRLPQGLQTRILEVQTKLGAPVRAFYTSWREEERAEEALRRLAKELVQAERALGVPLFLVVELAHGFEQSYLNPRVLVERRFPACVIREAGAQGEHL